jgi:hypothetical protein
MSRIGDRKYKILVEFKASTIKILTSEMQMAGTSQTMATERQKALS